MRVQEIMTDNPACCSPDSPVSEAATLMANNGCGELPVTDERGRPIGVVTDRDITCRAVAQGQNGQTPVNGIMSRPVVTTTPETNLEDCCRTLENNQIRRAPVVDGNGACCGVISQADIARYTPESDAGELLYEVSKP